VCEREREGEIESERESEGGRGKGGGGGGVFKRRMPKTKARQGCRQRDLLLLTQQHNQLRAKFFDVWKLVVAALLQNRGHVVNVWAQGRGRSHQHSFGKTQQF
jgi:hypothetical protein